MDVPGGFTPFENQGPFLEHIGPVYVRDGERDLVRARAVWIVAG